MTASDGKKNDSTESQAAGSAGNYNNSQGSGSQGGGYQGGSGGSYGNRREYGGGYDKPKAGAMEVHVEHNIEKAMRVLKRKLIKEGLFKELKSRRYYEKPSERRKRKEKESHKKARKEEARQKKSPLLFS